MVTLAPGNPETGEKLTMDGGFTLPSSSEHESTIVHEMAIKKIMDSLDVGLKVFIGKVCSRQVLYTENGY